MATGMYGANPQGLREIGAGFAAWGDSIEGIGFDLSGQIQDLEWVGSDADTYRADWGDKLRFDLSDIGDRLRDIRADFDAQADAQDDASAAGDSEGCLESTWNGFTEFLGGLFVDGLWGTVTSIWESIVDIPRMLGFDENWNWSPENLREAWEPLGPFIGYNPEDGTWWNWGLAGDAWWGQVKDFLAWDMWAENWPRALGQVVWNVGSIFIGIGIVKRIDGILSTGRRGGDGDGDVDVPGASYASGDPHFPGNHPPGRPTVGSSDGGPGEWTQHNRRPGAWQDYQEQITGVKGDPGRPIEYAVRDGDKTVDYDGRTQRSGPPPSEVYLEAKGENPVFNDKNIDKPWAQAGQATEIGKNITQIERQLDAMPDGAKLEWHVENQAHADALRARAEQKGLDVEIIHTPRT